MQSELSITDAYFELEIRQNTVLLLGLGHHVRGNLLYILDELNHNPEYEHLTIYVRTGPETDQQVREFIRSRSWGQTHTVLDDQEYGCLMESARYLLTEVYFPEGWIKKEGQTVINIWHGTPLKKMGLEKKARTSHRNGNTQKNFIAADYLLYPNAYTKKHMLQAYRVRNLMEGKAVMLGYPRTSGILNCRDEAEIRKRLAPNDEMIYAYMPTWKDYMPEEDVVAEAMTLLAYLDAHLTDRQILYVNLHHKINDGIDYTVYRRIRRFPADMDSYQLLAVTQALVSDYSSVFFDYLASGKNIVLYCPDMALYRKKRGTYLDMEKRFPFHIVKTPEEVVAAINAGKTYDDAGIREKFCAYDSSDNAKKLCRLFLGDESGLTIQPVKKKPGRQILIFTESMQDAEKSRLFQDLCLEYESLHPADDVYLSCDNADMRGCRKNAYPFFRKQKVFGLKSPVRFRDDVKEVYAGYRRHRKRFSRLADTAWPQLKANMLRCYGTCRFDRVLLYDTDDAWHFLMFLAAMGPDRLTVVVWQTMLDSIRSGSRLLKDALKAYAGTGQPLYVCSRQTEKDLRALLGLTRRKQVVLLDSVSDLAKMIK